MEGNTVGIWNVLYGYIGRLFCLILLLSIAQALCVYVALGIVVDKTIHLSEKNGFHDYSAFKRLSSQMPVLRQEAIIVDHIKPDWGNNVSKLGEPMAIVVSYHMEIPCFGKLVGVTLHYKGEGVNTGFYGTGY